MSRNNCFDLLRLIAASMVIYFHHSLMYGIVPPKLGVGFEIGSIGVQIFFSISGFLVAMSFSRSKGYLDFMEKRVRRIFPALIVVSFAMVYIMAPMFQGEPWQYITSLDAFKKFLQTSTMYGSDVPNLWSAYSLSPKSNGPLWTLPYEFFMYVAIGIMLSMFKSWKVPAAAVVGCFLLVAFYEKELGGYGFYYTNAGAMAKFGMNFFLGSLLFMTIDKWNKRNIKIFLLLLSATALFTLQDKRELTLFAPMAITMITLIVGLSVNDKVIDGRFDISYGLYIWAWPIQILVFKNITLDFIPSLIVSYMITTVIASMSWFLIEKRFLKRTVKIEAQKQPEPTPLQA